MELTYNEKVFRELRIYAADKSIEDKKSLAGAATLNENLMQYGWVLAPEALKAVIENMSLEGMKKMQDDIIAFTGDVKAEPMYPGFPQEVLEMDEAQYRLDQLCHYFSTYGIEYLTGRKVTKGWLPHEGEEKETEKKFNGFSADLKKIDVVFGEDKWIVPVKTILSRTSRMTEVEKDIVKEAVSHISEDQLSDLSVPFKENIYPVFKLAIEKDIKSLSLAHAACQHSGDVIKCAKAYLGEKKYRLKTYEKKFIVKLLELYDIDNFRENLCLSAKKADEAEMVIRHLNYNHFSRSDSHKKAVKDLRDGKLKSWASRVESLLAKKSESALDMIEKRPGMMLRMLNRLVNIGYDFKDITERLARNASALSTTSLVKVMMSTDYTDALVPVLSAKLKSAETPLLGKKVYIDEQGYDLAHSYISKTEEGGYVRSGMAFKIPESAGIVRFFIYWNDSERVDIDLHANASDVSGDTHHIGWNGDFNDLGICTSGDITHSDAAEYIDIDMRNRNIDKVSLTIDLFAGKYDFAHVDETLAGIMGISSFGENIAKYDPKSCFVAHKLVSPYRSLSYGYIDVQNHFMRYEGEASSSYYGEVKDGKIKYSIEDYLKTLLDTQNCTVVENAEDADITLSVAKGGDVSLIDENFFQDC